MPEEDRIRQLAGRFRKAILKCDRAELPLSLADFPTESCADASVLLGSYLKDNGIDGFLLVKGRRGEGVSLETHYWLERGDMIVDITADQFEDVDEQVVVADINSSWYASFVRSIQHGADYRVIVAEDVREHLGAVYEYVLEAGRESGLQCFQRTAREA